MEPIKTEYDLNNNSMIQASEIYDSEENSVINETQQPILSESLHNNN